MSDGSKPDLAPDLDESALVIADRKGRIVYWSSGATVLFGYEAQTMVGKAASVLVPAAYRRKHSAGWRQAWATGALEPSGPVMVPVVCADGETRTHAGHIFPVRDPYGRLLAVGAAWTPLDPRDGSLRSIDTPQARRGRLKEQSRGHSGTPAQSTLLTPRNTPSGE